MSEAEFFPPLYEIYFCKLLPVGRCFYEKQIAQIYATGGFIFSVPPDLFKCHKELAKPNYYQLCSVFLQLRSVFYCFLSRGVLVLGPFLRQGASDTRAVGGSSPQLFSLTAWWKPKTSLETQSSVLLKRQQNKIW